MDYSLWGALATSFVICAASGPVLIPLLHKLKFGTNRRLVNMDKNKISIFFHYRDL